jgi:hypothetical protein
MLDLLFALLAAALWGLMGLLVLGLRAMAPRDGSRP